MTRAPIKTTVYIPCHNYGRYLAEAMESVVGQIATDWELVVFDDGSEDDTASIAATFAKRDPDRIHVVRHDTPRGVIACANEALEMAHGEYFMRLDADDFLDESALLVMAGYLDRHADVALVFPNYFYVDAAGRHLLVENRKKIGPEAKLLDIPAHGACTMVRKRVLKSVGGYSATLEAQDGHDLWLKIVGRHKAANLSTPLFHYRQHDTSLSRDDGKLFDNRQRIKRLLAERQSGAVKPRIVCIVPVKNTFRHTPDVALRPLVGRPLIDYTIEQAQRTQIFDTIFVSTDDMRVVDHCRRHEGVLASLRPEALSNHEVRFSGVIDDAVVRLERDWDIYPDIVVALSIHTPLRKPEQILEAVDTLRLYNCDSVVSVYEDRALHFRHGEYGLEPMNPGMVNNVRLDREALFVDNRAVKAMWRDFVTADDIYGQRISHIVMSEHDSIAASSEFNLWLIARMLTERAAGANT